MDDADAMPSDRNTTTPSLADHARHAQARPLAELFRTDPDRFRRLSLTWDGWLVDVSKERLTADALGALVEHARACGIEGWIRALVTGERVNLTEQRAALHTALRQQDEAPVRVDGQDVIPQIRAVQARMQAMASRVRAGVRVGATGRPLRNVVNIGIGGSDLGPLLVCDALGFPARDGEGLRVQFVSNVDPEHLARTLAPLDPATTLFIVTSKTFTTQETLANATAAKAWLVSAFGPGTDPGRHFIAVSANVEAARAFGIAREDVLPMWDWVGGRYSLWSAVGLAIALRLGWDRFAALLAGAASMDEHFRKTPLEQNLPVVLGLVGWWNAHFMGHGERVVVPYAQALARLPAYLQQLVLESNGKRVTRDGQPIHGPTSPSLWGEPGTNGQHAFFQWLHQGTREVPVEFIVPLHATHPIDDQHTMLVANAIAQAQALLVGRPEAVLHTELGAAGMTPAELDAAIAARVCPGNRASTMLMMPAVDAHRLGQLLALYEHRTFVEAMLFGINPFDQFGVELGKTLARPVLAALSATAPLPANTDASTAGLVEYARTARLAGTGRTPGVA